MALGTGGSRGAPSGGVKSAQRQTSTQPQVLVTIRAGGSVLTPGGNRAEHASPRSWPQEQRHLQTPSEQSFSTFTEPSTVTNAVRAPRLDANSSPGVSHLGEMRTQVGKQLREIIVSGQILDQHIEECPQSQQKQPAAFWGEVSRFLSQFGNVERENQRPKMFIFNLDGAETMGRPQCSAAADRPVPRAPGPRHWLLLLRVLERKGHL